MQTGKKVFLKLALYGMVFVSSVLLAGYFLWQAKTSQRELRQIGTAQEIEVNMPIGLVIKKFGLSEQEVYGELQLPVNHWNKRYTIAQICQKKKLDCSAVVANLNKKIAK